MRPPDPVFVPAPAGIAAELAALAERPGAPVHRMLTGDDEDPDSLDGFFRLESAEGDLFLKAVPPERRPALEAAERIAGWLAGRGVRTNAALPGYPRLWRDRFAVFAHPFVDGGFASSGAQAEDQIRRLGRALAGLHRALAALPLATDPAADPAAAWDARRGMLETARRAVLDGQPIGPPWLASLLEEPFELDGAAQPVHADLHLANVLFPRDGGEPVFLDFEDCAHTVLPPVADVAKALERFVLVPIPDDARALTAGRVFLRAYMDAASEGGSASGTGGRAGALRTALHAQSRRALCDLAAQTLAARTLARRPPAAAEWNKFAALLNMLEGRRALVDGLDGIWRDGARCDGF